MPPHIFSTGLTVAALLGTATQLDAAALWLTPGQSSASLAEPVPTTALAPGASGTVVAQFDSGEVQEQSALAFTAQVRSVVVSGDQDNTLGGLSFYYRLDNVADDATGGASLQRLGVPLYAATPQVAMDQDISGNTSDLVGLSSGTPGSFSFWFFGDGHLLTPGDSSAWLVIHTALSSLRQGSVGIIGTLNTQNVPALVPIPEAPTFAVGCVLGLTGLVAVRRWRTAA